MGKPDESTIGRWLIKADHDLFTAKTMLATDPPVTDTACFHAQQCVEKCLKAFLVFAGTHVEKTHYLPRLVELCRGSDSSFQELEDIAIDLTDYAVSDRYPDAWREIPLNEAKDAVQKAETVTAFVRAKLSAGPNCY